MDGETASWIFYSGLLMYGLVLFAFKRLYLDTLGSRVLSYMLGLVLAYGILAGVFLASRESMVVRTVLQEALWSGRTYTYQGAGFLLIIVPAVYSIFLLRFFEKGGKNEAWKEKVQMMGSVSVNTVMALLGAIANTISYVFIFVCIRKYSYGSFRAAVLQLYAGRAQHGGMPDRS